MCIEHIRDARDCTILLPSCVTTAIDSFVVIAGGMGSSQCAVGLMKYAHLTLRLGSLASEDELSRMDFIL